MPRLYAQLKTLLLGGERYWFTRQEEAAIQQANLMFNRTSPAAEASPVIPVPPAPVRRPLCIPYPKLSPCCAGQPGQLIGTGMQEFSRALVAAGVERKHTEKGNRYRVMPIT